MHIGVAGRMILFAVALMCATRVSAGGDSRWVTDKIWPAYPAGPKACYVLLIPNSVEVLGENQPVCNAMLESLNRFCDEAPLYDRRKVDRSNPELYEPDWQPIDVKTNLELVKNVCLASVIPENRDAIWARNEGLVLARAGAGTLKLSRADLGNDLRGGLQWVFMLENVSPDGRPKVTNQPLLMFAERGRQTTSPLISPLSMATWGFGDLWRFRDKWYLVQTHSTYGWFEVRELMRPTPGARAEIAAPIMCRIQHVKDRQGRA